MERGCVSEAPSSQGRFRLCRVSESPGDAPREVPGCRTWSQEPRPHRGRQTYRSLLGRANDVELLLPGPPCIPDLRVVSRCTRNLHRASKTAFNWFSRKALIGRTPNHVEPALWIRRSPPKLTVNTDHLGCGPQRHFTLAFRTEFPGNRRSQCSRIESGLGVTIKKFC